MYIYYIYTYIIYIHIWSILTLSNPEALRRAVPALSAASRLIHFEANEDANLADLHLPLELDVDKVWPGFHDGAVQLQLRPKNWRVLATTAGHLQAAGVESSHTKWWRNGFQTGPKWTRTGPTSSKNGFSKEQAFDRDFHWFTHDFLLNYIK